MRGVVLALAGALALGAVAPGVAHAQADDVPPARFGIMMAGRQFHGDVGEVYDYGILGGFLAGYKPSWLPIGAMWSVLFGRYGAANDSVADQTLSTVEMSFGAQARYALSKISFRYLFATGGATLLRSENTLPPDDDRIFIGPYAGAGYEEYLLGRFLVSGEVRYGLLVGGPRGLSIHLSISFGTL